MVDIVYKSKEKTVWVLIASIRSAFRNWRRKKKKHTHKPLWIVRSTTYWPLINIRWWFCFLLSFFFSCGRCYVQTWNKRARRRQPTSFRIHVIAFLFCFWFLLLLFPRFNLKQTSSFCFISALIYDQKREKKNHTPYRAMCGCCVVLTGDKYTQIRRDRHTQRCERHLIKIYRTLFVSLQPDSILYFIC